MRNFLHNQGRSERSIEITGHGQNERHRERIGPGETKVIQLELEPGSYTIACPEQGRESEARMKKSLDVTGPTRAADEAEYRRNQDKGITDRS